MAEKKIMAYSVKAKKMVEMQNPKLVTLKNGRKAWTGTCPETGVKLFRFTKADEKE